MPAVSVIVLVYKAEGYIARCARSLFGQSLEDMEYIFVDDCSPDRSMDVLDRVLDGYPRRRSQVKILRNEVNLGQALSRQKGVEAASGRYIIHCDSDDYVDTDIYAKLYAKATEENLDMVICGVKRIRQGVEETIPEKLGAADLMGALLSSDLHHFLVNKLVCREAYEKGVQFPKGNMCEDTAIVIQLAYNCKSHGYVYEDLYYYDQRPESTSFAKDTVDKFSQIKLNADLVLSFLDSKGLSLKYAREIVRFKCWVKSTAFNLPRRYYAEAFPEVNFAFVLDRRFSVMERLGHITKLLGIHGLSRLIKKK